MDEFNQVLKNHRLKRTSARQVIFEILSNSPRALSPKEVFLQISKKTDLVSVYRNLSLFSEIGLTHRFQDGRYALCQHKHKVNQNHKHVHFMMNCVSCGLTKELDEHPSDLRRIASSLKKHSQPLMTFDSILLQGQCSDCSLN